MKEKRELKRLKEFKEITITVISEGKNLPKEKSFNNYRRDISVSGAKIKSNIFLPVDTLLKLDFPLQHPLYKQITALGKIKWIKIIIEDESYEAGVEFVNTPSEAIQKLEDYISWKRKGGKV
jgi:hypothetical protein